MVNAPGVAVASPEAVLAARGRRQVTIALLSGVALLACAALVVVAFANMVASEEPAPLDVVLFMVLVWAAIALAVVLLVAVSMARRARYRIVLSPDGIRLRDGRTVPWRDVARIADDPMSPDRICLWLVERATPAPPSGVPLEQPSPVPVLLRGLDGTPAEARSIIERRWREALDAR